MNTVLPIASLENMVVGGLGGLMLLVYLGVVVFLITLAWRAVKALEDSSRSQREIVVAIRAWFKANQEKRDRES